MSLSSASSKSSIKNAVSLGLVPFFEYFVWVFNLLKLCEFGEVNKHILINNKRKDIIKPYLTKYGLVGKENYPEKPKENAILTLEDLEKIMCNSIVYFNSKRINNLPSGKEFLKPYANELFLDSFNEYPNTFINVSNGIIFQFGAFYLYSPLS